MSNKIPYLYLVSGSVDGDDQVGFNISLRCIFKPSYSPHDRKHKRWPQCANQEGTRMGIEVLIINIVLAVPVYFVCRHLFKKLKDSRFRQAGTWVTTILVTPVTYILLVMVLVEVLSYYPERTFDKEVWETDVENRYEIADDLIENGRLMGKSKDEIRDLLGEKEVDFNGDKWTYYIGTPPRLLQIDPDVLEIEFENDKVIKTYIRRT